METWVSRGEDGDVEAYEHPDPSRSVITVAGLIPGHRATFQGRVSQVEDTTEGRRTLRSIVVGDNSGEINVTFRSGRGGADIQPGQLLQITGKARQSGNRTMSMTDPAYHVVEAVSYTHLDVYKRQEHVRVALTATDERIAAAVDRLSAATSS